MLENCCIYAVLQDLRPAFRIPFSTSKYPLKYNNSDTIVAFLITMSDNNSDMCF